jgi:hypothetical protein
MSSQDEATSDGNVKIESALSSEWHESEFDETINAASDETFSEERPEEESTESQRSHITAEERGKHGAGPAFRKNNVDTSDAQAFEQPAKRRSFCDFRYQATLAGGSNFVEPGDEPVMQSHGTTANEEITLVRFDCDEGQLRDSSTNKAE